MKDIVKIVCGYKHILFLNADGNVYGIGDNQYGQLSLPKLEYYIPSILNISNVYDIVCYLNHSVFLTNRGEVYICGQGISKDLVKIGDNISCISTQQGYILMYSSIMSKLYIYIISEEKRVAISMNYKIVKIVSGTGYSIFLDPYGNVYGLGENTQGQLGLGSIISVDHLHKINIDNIIDIACGYQHTIFIKKDGTVYGCGSNMNYQLGLENNVLSNIYSVTKIPIEDHIVNASCSYWNTIFVTDVGNVYFTGYNGNIEIPIDMNIAKIPILVPNVDSIVYSAIKQNAVLLLRDDGKITTYGSNDVY